MELADLVKNSDHFVPVMMESNGCCTAAQACADDDDFGSWGVSNMDLSNAGVVHPYLAAEGHRERPVASKAFHLGSVF